MDLSTFYVSAPVAAVLVNILTNFLKKVVFPRWGKTGVQFIVIVLAALAALYITFESAVPQLKVFIASTIAIVSLAISLYEVLWSKIGKVE